MRSADFERTDGKESGWWDWKPEKSGARSALRRRRTDDRPARALPAGLRPARARPPRLATTTRRPAEVAPRARRSGPPARSASPPHRWAAGLLPHRPGDRRPPRTSNRSPIAAASSSARVEGSPEPAYVHRDNLRRWPKRPSRRHARVRPSPRSSRRSTRSSGTARGRRRLFDFDYRIECYTPRRTAPLRLLHPADPATAARSSAGSTRRRIARTGVFEVKSLHLEEGIAVSGELVAELRDALRRCAEWHQTPEIAVTSAN